MKKKKVKFFVFLSVLLIVFVYFLHSSIVMLFQSFTPIIIGNGRYLVPICCLPVLMLLVFNIVCVILGLFQKNKPKIQCTVSIIGIVITIALFFSSSFYIFKTHMEYVTGEDALISSVSSLSNYGTFPIDTAERKVKQRKSFFDASFYGMEYEEFYQLEDKTDLTYQVWVLHAKNSRWPDQMFRMQTEDSYMLDGKPNSYYESDERYCQWIGDDILLNKIGDSILYYHRTDELCVRIHILTDMDGVALKSQEELFTLCQAQFEALQKEHAFD